MNHVLILPILIPLLTGIILLLPPLNGHRFRQRLASTVSTLILLTLSLTLVMQASAQAPQLYALGNWEAPFGIVLVLDPLSALMVALTSLLALPAVLYACAGTDEEGTYFHPLFQFQLMGINGAFLTGDIFNLFVFFEVLLIASYALLLHGGGKARTKAGLHYVILNLAGSALFLFALGILYGTLGTLNMADMAVRVRALSAEEAPLVAVGGLMLLVVFALKAAMVPLHYWLQRAYASASAPVAALFAIMTKIGIYALLRVFTQIFGEDAGELAGLGRDWIWPLALITLAIGAIATISSRTLRQLTANLVIMSVGTLLAALAIGTERATSAALYYLIHSTLITAALFLIADMVGRQRGKAGDRIVAARAFQDARLLGVLFLIAGMAVVGLPPLSGFVGKALLLNAAESVPHMAFLWPVLLGGSLFALVAFSRSGSSVFWRVSGEPAPGEATAPLRTLAALMLLAAAPIMVLLAAPISTYTQLAASALHQGSSVSPSAVAALSLQASQGVKP